MERTPIIHVMSMSKNRDIAWTAQSSETAFIRNRIVKLKKNHLVWYAPADCSLSRICVAWIETRSGHFSFNHRRLKPDKIEQNSEMSGDHKTIINGNPSQYVKLNVGGRLYYTTIATLTAKKDTMLQAMFSGRMEVLTDSEGKILQSSIEYGWCHLRQKWYNETPRWNSHKQVQTQFTGFILRICSIICRLDINWP